MTWFYLIFSLTVISSACAHNSNSAAKPSWPRDARMAQAQILPVTNLANPQGNISFEQMPNSVIITYRFEGLEPKGQYQVFLHRDQDCNSLTQNSGEILTRLRANKTGVSENTFKSENLRVNGDTENALHGDSVVLATAPTSGNPQKIACSEIGPQTGKIANQ